ncbi:MAG: hypothetical protein ACOX4K_10875 [Bacillota bacterium]
MTEALISSSNTAAVRKMILGPGLGLVPGPGHERGPGPGFEPRPGIEPGPEPGFEPGIEPRSGIEPIPVFLVLLGGILVPGTISDNNLNPSLSGL